MEASRLTFTNEFKERAAKGLSRRQIGELRWKKILELDEQGVLQNVHNRKQFGALVGITKPKTYHQWVAGLIKSGKISETLRGFENNKAVLEYHVESTPTVQKKKPVMNVEKQVVQEVEKQTSTATITVTFANSIVKIEGADANIAVEIIKAMK